MTFLKQAPPARQFWARRQCHETTVHALDALAARDQRPLTSDDVWLTRHLAADGVDELLVGFWQRRTKGPRSETPYTATVSVTDGPAWRLDVTDLAPVTRRHDPHDGIAGARRSVAPPPTSTSRCGTAAARSTTPRACSTSGGSAAAVTW